MMTPDTRPLRMATIFDEVVESRPVPHTFDSGDDPAVLIYDGMTRGSVVLARCGHYETLLGVKVQAPPEGLQVTLRLTLDEVSHQWWQRKLVDMPPEDSQYVRHIVIRCQGRVVGGVTLTGMAQTVEHTFVIREDLPPHGGLLMIALEPFDSSAFSGATNFSPVRGIQIDSLTIDPFRGQPDSQGYVSDERIDGRCTTQGCVVTNRDPVILRFAIKEQPPLPELFQSTGMARAVGRGLRKSSVWRRRASRRASTAVPALRKAEVPVTVTALTPEGLPIQVERRLLDNDVVEVEFAATGETVFFELTADPAQLAAAGFAERVVFDLL